MISKSISLGVLLIWVPVASFADDELGDEIGGEAPLSSPEWEETLDGLRSDSFLARETAAAALVALPKEALPWLDEKVAKAGGDDPEYTHRLASAAKLLRERLAEADLDNGLQVSLSMEDAKADAVFKAIQDIAPRPLIGSDARSPWADGVPKAYYGFEGSYWGAIDHLFEVFPPGAPPNRAGRRSTKSTICSLSATEISPRSISRTHRSESCVCGLPGRRWRTPTAKIF